MKDVVRSAVFPILLGYGKTARMTAWRLFADYGVRSVLLDREKPLGAFFSLFFTFRKLPSVSDEFTLMSLERLSDEQSDMTCLIIPCTEHYAELIKRNRARLECRFILRSPGNAVRVTPVK